MSDDEEWSREGKEADESQQETAIEAQILAQAEAIIEPNQTTSTAPYDTHLRFIGKKLSDINYNLRDTSEHLSWLSFVLKLGLAINALTVLLIVTLFILSLAD